jgi:hypothetical protein
MNETPQKTIVDWGAAAATRERAERVADVVGHVLDLGALVAVGQDHGVVLPGQPADLGLERRECGRVARRRDGYRTGAEVGGGGGVAH